MIAIGGAKIINMTGIIKSGQWREALRLETGEALRDGLSPSPSFLPFEAHLRH